MLTLLWLYSKTSMEEEGVWAWKYVDTGDAEENGGGGEGEGEVFPLAYEMDEKVRFRVTSLTFPDVPATHTPAQENSPYVPPMVIHVCTL